MSAYYNEIDPYAAQWLRNLIEAGEIAPGIVDERSIEDVTPGDLRGFTQCHFFAGVGVWSYALRQAGWKDDRAVWTGSCPCQPFSAAGAGAGFEDTRHLWPSFAWLIEQCKPPVIFGEQVASKTVGPWVDLVHANVEAMGYAFGAVAFPSAGVGAPHIRERTYWCADAERSYRRCEASPANHREQKAIGPTDWTGGYSGSPVAGFWRNSEWVQCKDGRARPFEPGVVPVVDGFASRVEQLRAYGNAINAQAAQEFIGAYLDTQI